MRRLSRILGTLMIVAGLGSLGWAVTVWQWQDPLTLAVNTYEQRKLSQSFERSLGALEPAPAAAAAPSATPAAATPEPVDLAARAKAWRKQVTRGDAVARIKVPKIGVDDVIVNGTDTETLKRGPGRYLGSAMPGEGELVYVAGHRTTYGAPFARIDRLAKGDTVVVETPYATFEYAITGKRIVGARQTEVLKSKGFEQLALQACHPRFFATQRLIAYAKLVSVTPRATGAEA